MFAQDCPDGEKCVPFDSDGDGAWDSAKCVEVTADGEHGDPCESEGAQSGADTCAKGHVCWNVDEDGVGVCVAQCAGTPEQPVCAPSCTSCVISGDGVLNLCFTGCDPLAQDCWGGEVCIPEPSGDRYVCVLDASGGMGPAGTPCEFANVCNPGLMCANTATLPHPACGGALGCCAPFCNFEQPGDTCAALAQEVPGVECVPLSDEPVECAGPVGLCSVP